MRLAIWYVIFALIATASNIAAQDFVVRWYGGEFLITISVLAGTAVGLLVKYALDKRFIFRFRTRDAFHDGWTFMLYTLMGLATTAIFWAFEFAFESVFGGKAMRYLGAVIGLGIGYFVKYHLDRRYVFAERRQ